MKIEKINDNQIRCTLTRQDLADREIKLSELAYGTEKAKLLFRDMMQQAAYEFGFEANDIPLMIEAIPISSDSVIRKNLIHVLQNFHRQTAKRTTTSLRRHRHLLKEPMIS